MEPKIILPTNLDYFKRFGRYKKRSIHIENLSDVSILHFGKPLILKNKDEIWTIDLVQEDKSRYQKHLVKSYPGALDYSTQSNTFYTTPPRYQKYDTVMDYLLESRDIELLIQKLDLDFGLVTRHFLSDHVVLTSMSQNASEKIYDLRLFLSKIGLGSIASLTTLYETYLSGREYLIVDISDEEYDDEYKLLEEYFQDEPELYLNRSLLDYEEFEEDEFLTELLDVMDTSGIKEFIFYR